MDYEAAIAEYKKVLSISPDSEIAQDAQYWIGQSHFRAGQFDVAQATFAELIEQYPTSAIVPVAKLMTKRVAQAKEDEKKRRVVGDATEKGFVGDPDTNVRFTKARTFTGNRDVIEYTVGLNLSANGKFLLHGGLVIPLDSGDPFDLVDMPVLRGKWSPDGKKAAFYSRDAIWVVPVSPETGQSTGPPKKLLDGRFRFGRPVSWSPDGQKLAFARFNEGQSYDVRAISVADGSLTQIASTPTSVSAPAWSPDGKVIAYGRSGNKNSIWLSSVDGQTARKVVDIDSEHRCIPIWSPDGKWIVLEPGRDRTLRFIRLADKKMYALKMPRPVGNFFSWSPDGRKVLFYNPSYGYKSALKVVSAYGGPTLELGRGLKLWPYEHFWSLDSKMIITHGDYLGDDKFWIIPLSGADPVVLEMNVSVDGDPFPLAVSQNVKKLAFVVKRNDGAQDLFVAPISLQDARTTGPAVKVFDEWHRIGGGVYTKTASWSPGGNRLAVIHRGDVWIASANGDKPVQITNTKEQKCYPWWSPDGKMVYYAVLSAKGTVVYMVAASGGEATTITGGARGPWAPDSKSRAVVSNGLISVVPVAGGQTRQIADLRDIGLAKDCRLRWSPDGKYIACTGYHIEEGRSGPIPVIPVEGGKVTKVATHDQGSKILIYWSPDGKWISYHSDGTFKTRSEGSMWEADFGEILEKASVVQ
jgi:Tol biopolymer transport system component